MVLFIFINIDFLQMCDRWYCFIPRENHKTQSAITNELCHLEVNVLILSCTFHRFKGTRFPVTVSVPFFLLIFFLIMIFFLPFFSFIYRHIFYRFNVLHTTVLVWLRLNYKITQYTNKTFAVVFALTCNRITWHISDVTKLNDYILLSC